MFSKTATTATGVRRRGTDLKKDPVKATVACEKMKTEPEEGNEQVKSSSERERPQRSQKAPNYYGNP